MAEQYNGSADTQIVYSPAGGKLALMNAQTLKKAFVPLPGGGAAVYGASGTIAYYRHPDWLGSSRFASSPGRTCYSDLAYAPYGEKYSASTTCTAQDLDFTGQNQDTASFTYDFLLRQYNATSSRWIQPDPAGLGVANPANPQTWNRYAYVANYPLGFVDSGGLGMSDANGTQEGCRGDPAGCSSYSLNNVQVPDIVALSDLGMNAAVNIGSISPVGFNQGANGNSYAYAITATSLGIGFNYLGVDYGTARYELGLPTSLTPVLTQNQILVRAKTTTRNF